MLSARQVTGAAGRDLTYSEYVLMVRDSGVSGRVALGAILAACSLLVAGSAGASPLDGAKAPAQVRDYWTPGRMRDAVPLNPLAGVVDAKRRGTIAKPVRRSRRRPNRSHGKVFFRLGGTNYVCSGTAVRAPGENVVWTAGHCVYGSTNGKAPFGEWPQLGGGLQATSQWKLSSEGCLPVTSCGDVAHDFGAANVAKLGGRSLQDVVGGRPIQFNGPRDRIYKAIGYPQGAPFSGGRMFGCRSAYKGEDSGQGSPAPMRITCDMTGGSSGGGWVAGGKVASVVSYGYADEPSNLYGPYQGASAHALFNQVKSG